MFSPNIYTQAAAIQALVVVEAALDGLHQRLSQLKRQKTANFAQIFEVRAAIEVAETDAAWLTYRDEDRIDAILGSDPENATTQLDAYMDWLLLLPIIRSTRH